MKLIMTIAWRNVLRHRGKSIIIGVILFLGSLLMTVGNGVISGMDRGLEMNIVNGFLGDIVVIPAKEKSDNVLFKLYGESIGPITNYKEIKKVLEREKYLKEFMPVGKNVALVLNEEEGDPGYTLVLGVDFERYRRFFPDSFKPVEGRLLNKNETGIMIPLKSREEIYNHMGIWYLPENCGLADSNLSDDARDNKKNLRFQNTAVFMGISDGESASDIRLGIKGILQYRALNRIWGYFSIMDIESYRRCLGYFAASDVSAKIPEEKKRLLDMEDSNLDSMFGNSAFIVNNRGVSDISRIDMKRRELKTGGDVDIEAGVYNMILVKLRDNISPDEGLRQLNTALSGAGLGMRAVSWKKASGFIGSMAAIINGALIAFVTFLFFVAIIIIVNTLTMAALERTPEIGMMRAIGARRSFISGMFIGETAILSSVFGGLGVLAGIITVKIIPHLGITSSNDLVQLLFGGDRFSPYLSAGDLLVVISELVVVTLITVIYPVKIANSITPLDAISRD